MMEIVASAIMFYIVGDEYPTIMCGKRHSDILHKMYDMGIQYERETSIQGFITNRGKFLNRTEAFLIADLEGHLLPEAREKYKDVKITELYSEDIFE